MIAARAGALIASKAKSAVAKVRFMESLCFLYLVFLAPRGDFVKDA
jgi:hypothetical protein